MADPSVPPVNTTPILRISREIRQEIYQYFLVAADFNVLRNQRYHLNVDLMWLRDQQIQDEARHVLYRENSFCVIWTDGDTTRELLGDSPNLGQAARPLLILTASIEIHTLHADEDFNGDLQQTILLSSQLPRLFRRLMTSQQARNRMIFADFNPNPLVQRYKQGVVDALKELRGLSSATMRGMNPNEARRLEQDISRPLDLVAMRARITFYNGKVWDLGIRNHNTQARAELLKQYLYIHDVVDVHWASRRLAVNKALEQEEASLLRHDKVRVVLQLSQLCRQLAEPQAAFEMLQDFAKRTPHSGLFAGGWGTMGQGLAIVYGTYLYSELADAYTALNETNAALFCLWWVLVLRPGDVSAEVRIDAMAEKWRYQDEAIRPIIQYNIANVVGPYRRRSPDSPLPTPAITRRLLNSFAGTRPLLLNLTSDHLYIMIFPSPFLQ